MTKLKSTRIRKHDWRARVYDDNNDVYDRWVIHNKTEDEAKREVSADVENMKGSANRESLSDYGASWGWKLTPLRKRKND